ncbi:MAG: C39 family peptidase [Akkermansiaceae bacterium]|nr:C39 family peptidase [Akkermansiaceae bacterium]
MTLRPLLPVLAASSLFIRAEPLITLQEANGTDKLRIELLNLEKDIALLRRADGQEFDTPLAYLSEESREDIRTTWKTHRQKVEKHLTPLNKALGQTLFASNGNIWNESTGDVAKRLRLPLESETPFTSSYRLYTRSGYSFAGANPKTVVSYGDHNGRTLSLSIIYANKGDSLSNVGAGEDHFKDKGKSVDRNTLEGAMIYDAANIAKTLTNVLGEPTEQRMLGQGNESHQVQRWDWNGHSFLLAHVAEEYVGLNIVRASFADGGGRFSRVSDGDIRVRLKKSVTQEANGDVFIKDIPMVDQGPKGYCAPATFERAMRHAGVPADMYLLATLATEGGGGTNTSKLYDEVAFTTRSKGGRTARKIVLKSLAPNKIKRYIDKGVPILWQMCSLSGYNQVANARTRARREVKDWVDYATKIAAVAGKNAEALREKNNFHICMIIGYNETTNEVAVSDSWGKNYTIRWIHVDEAEAVNNKNGFVIDI